MDSDSLGPDDCEGGALLGRRSSQSDTERPEPSRNRRGSSTWMFILCILSIFALSGFTLLQWTQSQQPSDVRVPPADGGGEDHPPPATQDGGGAAPDTGGLPAWDKKKTVIPPSEYFDLKRTGFVVAADQPQVREYVFNITRAPGNPDGVYKSMILVNGQSPGPLIEANIGDTVRVVVNNAMTQESTTIHWHGIDQRDSVFMDGVAGVTQCGIPPGESFTYEFKLPNQRGSFWYHAHVGVQYTDGLYGPLIIHDPDEKVPAVDDDKVIMIGDLHHMDGRQAAAEYLSKSPSWNPGSPGTEPYPDNIIINGRHVFNCTSSAAECASGSLYTTSVKAHSNTRLRLISHSSNTPLWFTVDGHALTIVEMDGVEIEPLATTRVFMNPGQRYSVILHADQTPGNYLMRAAATCAMLDHHPGSSLSTVDSQGTGVLSYEGVDAASAPFLGTRWPVDGSDAPGSPVKIEPWGHRCHDLPFELAKPVRKLDAYEVGQGNLHYVWFRFDAGKDGVTRTYINDTTYVPSADEATVWTLPSQDLAFATTTTQLLERHVLVSRGELLPAQVAISAGNMMGHPWHLHGQNFQVVGWGKGVFGRGDSVTTWNLANPTRRDTVTVPGHSHVVIRYAADNPGVWALHCHIQWHAEGGMFVQTAQGLGRLKGMVDALGEGVGGVKGRFCTGVAKGGQSS